MCTVYKPYLEILQFHFPPATKKMYTLCHKNQTPKILKVPNRSDARVQLPSQFQPFVTSLYLPMHGFTLPSIHYNYLCQISDQQLKNAWYLMAMKAYLHPCVKSQLWKSIMFRPLSNEQNSSSKYSLCCCMLPQSITISVNFSF